MRTFGIWSESCCRWKPTICLFRDLIHYDRRREKNVDEWGRSWYLYDGEQDQFAKSLELSAEFIQEVIDNILNHITASRVAMIGYSMGGYQAGYFALSRWKHVNELVVIGGRIKTELFEEDENNYDHLNVLALHGSDDESVKSSPQQESCNQLAGWGASVTFNELKESHALSSVFLQQAKKWLRTLGYG
ncbi:MAG: alpha/beta fold hydrolase [Fodinibius sp.]|nr:alpha/beta fold hydrolase [Fodinibius sp.]